MDTLVNVYIDLSLVVGTSNFENLTDSTYIKERETIYKKYNITEAQVLKTIQLYDKDVHKWKEFFQAVLAKIENTEIPKNN